MKRAFRRAAAGVALLLGAGILVGAGGLVFLQSEAGGRFLVERIDAALPGRVQAGRLHLSLPAASLEVSGLVLSDPSGQPLAGVRRMFVDLDWKALAGGSIGVAQLTLEGPWAELVLDEKGRLNLAAVFSPASRRPEPPPPGRGRDVTPAAVVLQSVSVRDGTLGFVSRRTETVVRAEGIAIDGRADALRRFAEVSVLLERSSVQTPARTLRQGPVRLRGVLNGDRLEDVQLDWNSEWLSATASGSVDRPFDDPRLDVQVSGSADLETLERTFGFSAGLEGRPQADVTVRGPLANPSAVLGLRWKDGAVREVPVSGVAVDARLEDGTVRIERAEAAAASGRVRLEGVVGLGRRAGGPVWSVDPDALTYRLEGVVEDVAAHRVHPTAVGRISARTTVEGTGVVPETMAVDVDAAVDAEALSVDDRWSPVDAALRTRFAFSEMRFDVRELEVTAGRLRGSASGTVDAASRAFDVDLTVACPDLAASLAPLGIGGFEGRVEADARVRGPWRRPRGTGTVAGSGLAFLGWTFGEVDAEAGIDAQGVLSVQRLSVSNGGSRLEAEGALRIFGEPGTKGPPLRLRVRFSDVALKDFTTAAAVPGRFDGTLRLEGDFPRLRGEATVEGSGVAVAGIAVGRVAADLTWDETSARVRRLQARQGASVLDLQGDVQLLDPETLRPLSDPVLHKSRLEASIRLSDLFENLDGRVKLNAEIDGSVLRPRGPLHLTGTGLDLVYQKLEELRIDGRLEEDRLRVDSLQAAAAPGETLSATGWISLGREFAFSLDTAGVSTENIQVLGRQDAVRGILAARVEGRGDFRDPDIRGRLRLKEASVNRTTVPDFDIEAALDARTLRVDGQLNFDVNGQYDLHSGDYSLRAVFRDTELSPWLRLAGRPDLSGTLTGRATAEGNARRLPDNRVEAVVEDVRLAYKDLPLVRSGSGSASLRGSVLSVDALRLELFDAGALTVDGGGRLDGELDLTADGRVPVETARLFVDGLEDLAGSAAFSVHLFGTSAAPKVEGELHLENGGIRIPGAGRLLRDVRGTLRFRPERVAVDGLSASVDGGTLRLDGTVDLEALKPETLDLHLAAAGVPLELPNSLSLVLDADLRLTGPLQENRLAGRITVVEGEYTRDVDLNPLGAVGTKTRAVAPPSEGVSHPLLKDVALDVAIAARTPVLVDNNLAEMEILPDFHLGGTLGKPSVQGRAAVESGAVTFRKKRFEVTKGVIDFVNPYKIEPIFDIESTVQVREWEIFLYLSGTPDAMTFRLRSEPSESDADIVSLLLFGKTSQELAGSEGGFSGSTESMLASMIESRFGEDIKGATGLDIFGVDAGRGAGAAAGGDVTVTVGKELSNRLTVKYEAGSRGGEVVQRAVAEYRLLENLLVNGFQGTGGSQGAEVQFRLEFR